MSYAKFKNTMQALLSNSFQYTPSEVGFAMFSEKMAALADAYPEYDARLEAE